jgi:tetratricopeptide (TPR) repeat protein
MRTSAKLSWQEFLVQIKQLIRATNWKILEQSLPTALRLAQNLRNYQELAGLLEKSNFPITKTQTKLIYAAILLRARQFKKALLLLEPQDQDHIAGAAMLSLGLLRTNQPLAAQTHAELALLHQIQPDLAWRVLGEARFELGKNDWQEAFEKAVQVSTGRQLGLGYIEWGRCLEMNLEHAAARERWALAQPFFKYDAFYEAQIMANMGLSCARDLKIQEAEAHFSQLLKRSQHPDAKTFTSQAWKGFGIAWRSAGELKRAEFAYQKAIQTAREPFDQIQAKRGLGHTLRLQGLPSLALVPLHQALELQQEHQRPLTIYPDLAAAYLANGNQDSALEALGAWTGSGEDFERCYIVYAEIARQNQNPTLALEYAKNVRWHSLWGREELQAFPKLAELLNAMNLELPTNIAQTKVNAVQVKARGALQVLVNQRQIRINPTSRAAQVLVLLLEHHKTRSMRQLLEDLYPNTTPNETRTKQKNISKAVSELRTLLGWQESIVESGSVYSLDPNSLWQYDVEQAKAQNETVSVFMTGVDADWVLERLRYFDNQPRRLN